MYGFVKYREEGRTPHNEVNEIPASVVVIRGIVRMYGGGRERSRKAMYYKERKSAASCFDRVYLHIRGVGGVVRYELWKIHRILPCNGRVRY